MQETRVESWGLSVNLKAKNFDFKLKLSRFVGGQRFGDAHHLLPPKRSLLQKIRERLGKLKSTVRRRVCRGVASGTDGRTPPPDASKPATRTLFWPLNQVERSPIVANSQFLPSLAYVKLVGRIILYTVNHGKPHGVSKWLESTVARKIYLFN